MEQGVIDNMIISQKPFPGAAAAARRQGDTQVQDGLGALPLLGAPHACGGPARVADGQAVGRAL